MTGDAAMSLTLADSSLSYIVHCMRVASNQLSAVKLRMTCAAQPHRQVAMQDIIDAGIVPAMFAYYNTHPTCAHQSIGWQQRSDASFVEMPTLLRSFARQVCASSPTLNVMFVCIGENKNNKHLCSY